MQYRVTQTELWVRSYIVEAESEDAAVEALADFAKSGSANDERVYQSSLDYLDDVAEPPEVTLLDEKVD